MKQSADNAKQQLVKKFSSLPISRNNSDRRESKLESKLELELQSVRDDIISMLTHADGDFSQKSLDVMLDFVSTPYRNLTDCNLKLQRTLDEKLLKANMNKMQFRWVDEILYFFDHLISTSDTTILSLRIELNALSSPLERERLALVPTKPGLLQDQTTNTLADSRKNALGKASFATLFQKQCENMGFHLPSDLNSMKLQSNLVKLESDVGLYGEKKADKATTNDIFLDFAPLFIQPPTMKALIRKGKKILFSILAQIPQSNAHSDNISADHLRDSFSAIRTHAVRTRKKKNTTMSSIEDIFYKMSGSKVPFQTFMCCVENI